MLLPMFVRGTVAGADDYARGEADRIAANLPRDYNVIEEPPVEQDVSDVKIGFFLHTPFPSSEIYR